MVDPTTLAAFVPAALALILVPGPDTVFVLSRGVGGGRVTGLRAACGVATGILVHTALVLAGLAALLRAVPTAYLVVKYVGAVYLVVLGVRALAGTSSTTADGSAGSDDAGSDDTETGFEMAVATADDTTGSYRRGLLVNVLNPKVALFFLAFLPQFASPGDTAGLAALGGTYALLTVVYLGGVALGADTLSGRLADYERPLDRISGVVLVAFGVLTVGEDIVRVPSVVE